LIPGGDAFKVSESYTNGVNKWPLNEQNVGDRDTLASFIAWSMDNYPAENYYLALDDHGHGVYGVSWDETNNNDELTPPEVYSALKDATNNGDRKIDIIDYEACLMGIAEQAYDVSQWVDYVLFSQQISWGLNTYPNYFANLQAVDTPPAVGANIVQIYHTQANNEGRPHTISLINTNDMGAVKAAATALGDALSQNGVDDPARRNAVTAVRNNSQAFAGDVDATNPAYADYIDLRDLADKALSEGLISVSVAQQVRDAVNNAVEAEAHASGNVDNFFWDHFAASGLSVYYPAGNASAAFNDYTQGRLFQMTEDDGVPGHWDEFLVWAVPEGSNGTSGGIGGDDRKGLWGGRFLQQKGADSATSNIVSTPPTIYLPLVLK